MKYLILMILALCLIGTLIENYVPSTQTVKTLGRDSLTTYEKTSHF